MRVRPLPAPPVPAADAASDAAHVLVPDAESRRRVLSGLEILCGRTQHDEPLMTAVCVSVLLVCVCSCECLLDVDAWVLRAACCGHGTAVQAWIAGVVGGPLDTPDRRLCPVLPYRRLYLASMCRCVDVSMFRWRVTLRHGCRDCGAAEGAAGAARDGQPPRRAQRRRHVDRPRGALRRRGLPLCVPSLPQCCLP